MPEEPENSGSGSDSNQPARSWTIYVSIGALIISVLSAAVSLGYWGGVVKTRLDGIDNELKEIKETFDTHDERIRDLEKRPAIAPCVEHAGLAPGEECPEEPMVMVTEAHFLKQQGNSYVFAIQGVFCGEESEADRCVFVYGQPSGESYYALQVEGWPPEKPRAINIGQKAGPVPWTMSTVYLGDTKAHPDQTNFLAHAVVGPCALGEELFQDRMPDSEVPSVPNIGNLVEQHPDIIAVSEPIEVEALANLFP